MRHDHNLDDWKPENEAVRVDAPSQKHPTLIGGSLLRVDAEVAPHADPSATHECRGVALDWLQDQTGTPLPRRATAHRSFSHTDRDSACRAVRIRDGRSDYWAAQLERTPHTGQATVTEVVVAHPEGHSPLVRIEVVDRSVVPADPAGEYPADMLADMAERVPLLLGGRTLSHTPIVVETADTMQGFHRMLVDPGRTVPFAVVSVPPDMDDLDPLKRQWVSLARALTGLAIVWVLPPRMTYRLSDLVTKSLSVFLGAWRFYRPGFNHLADRIHHPLFLKNRMEDDRGIEEIMRQFLTMAVEERMRAGTDGRLAIGYDNLAREEAAAGRGPARLVALLRDSLRTGSAEAPRTEDAPASAEDSHENRRADEAERERDEALRRAAQLAELVRALGGDPDAATPFPTAWEQFAPWCDENLGQRVSLAGDVRRELSGAEFEDVALAARCIHWLAHDYRENRLRGGDPHRHGRILDINEGVFNLPCEADCFVCKWGGQHHRVKWHLRCGANAHDPRRCLCIYYFWDEETQRVVVASMPSPQIGQEPGRPWSQSDALQAQPAGSGRFSVSSPRSSE